MNWSYYYVTQSGGYSQWGNSYGYDWQGNLKSGSVGGSNPYNFNYTYNTDNQITRRDQSYGSNQTNMHEVHYYFNGMAIGDISNNGSSNVDYAQSLANHRAVQGSGPFQNGATSGTTYANFDQSYDAINGQDYQSTSSLYTVQAGDTLQSIAYRLWGDSSFWYLIADANGMTSDQALVAGQDLVIPDKVHNVHNNADTFQVYDPNKAQGAHIPTPPKPSPQDNGSNCGIFGAIIVVVIAVVVSVLSYGTLSGPMTSLAASVGFSTGTAAAGAAAGAAAATAATVAGTSIAVGSAAAIAGGIAAGAIAGALGAIVSQGVALALGIQNKFDWGGVAMGAIGGAVGGGLAGADAFGSLEGDISSFGVGVLRGATGSLITQGIDVATGLQKKFDWTGVAADAIGSGVTNSLATNLGADHPELGRTPIRFVSGMAGALVNAAMRTLINGNDFGDNLIAALPSVIGATIGEAIEDRIDGTDSTAGAQSSGSQANGQQSSTPQTGAQVNAAISQPAASSGASGRPVSQANADDGVPMYVENVLVIAPRMTSQEMEAFDLEYAAGAFHDELNRIGTNLIHGTISTLEFAGHDPVGFARSVVSGGIAIAKNTVHSAINLAGEVSSASGRQHLYDEAAGYVHGAIDTYRVASANGTLPALIGTTAADVVATGVPMLIAPEAASVEEIGATESVSASTIGGYLPNAGGVIRQFTQEGDAVYYRVFSKNQTGSFLTKIPPKSSAYAREALALPPENKATFIQRVTVPDGTLLLRSRALPLYGRSGGAEQFQLLNRIPKENFGPGVPLP